ncbi:hypothetical protein F511_33840 [Dorcoceras hygrometricum]|uniref:Uncharacterized protein n=1 Tax=Dorcoceras hygrometricum TaxID=472368 RepID=A0A2Z7BFR5_9LAMI|nr:hypothetical protein F511_33840 [Dorcoceras hygrometricum]
MRSVVASHGPGSNPRGPKISKFQNRPKRARYRIPARKLHGLPGTGLNQTLEEISRHDIAGASSERRPTTAPPPQKSRRQRTTPRATARLSGVKLAQPVRTIIDQQRRNTRVGHGATSSHHNASKRATPRDQRPSTSRQSCGQRTAVARPARIARARKCGNSRPPHAQRLRVVQLHIPAAMRGQRAWLSRAHVRAAGGRGAAACGGGVAAVLELLMIQSEISRNTLLATRAWIQPELQERRLFTYGPFDPYIPIRSTTIGKSRVAIDPIAMHTSWRSNSDIASVTRTNQYNQDLGLIHSTNGNHLESPNEGSSIDHQVTIYLHAQNITMFPTNETWYFASQILVSNSGGFILILTAQSTRNMFRIHSDY